MDLYVDKYQPLTVDECILPDYIKQEFNNMICTENIPHLLLVGGAGVGKTTIAKILINTIKCEYLVFNGSSGELNIDALRDKITDFVSTVSINKENKFKFVFIDEADGLNKNIQDALRHLMEKYKNVRFILTANYPDKISLPIQSRCAKIDFKFDKDQMNLIIRSFANRVLQILEQEGIEYELDGIAFVCKEFFPDFRRTLNEIQRYVNYNGKLDSGIENGIHNSIAELFNGIINKDFTSIRDWVYNNNVSTIFNILFREYQNYIPENEQAMFILCLGEGMRYHNTVPNQELNVLSTLTNYINS
jgi:DNA polymerase III delta prime subunit